ncbi:MAG: Holliday junction branch migration protein RuvA [Candidatus Sumerlaeota bacterium]
MMIEYLKGTLLSIEQNHVVIDTGGVGYGVDLPDSTASKLPEIGQELALYVSTVVREDAILLYGFATSGECAVFEILRDISGVGPRTGLDMLSTISVRALLSAVRSGNTNALTAVPGIGPKKAERLIVDLKGKVKQLSPYASVDSSDSPAELQSAGNAGGALAAEPAQVGQDKFGDAVDALAALGMKPAEASRNLTSAMRLAEDPDSLSVEELVRLALQVGR